MSGAACSTDLPRLKGSDVGEMKDRHLPQISMAQHRSFRTTRRPRGVEQPCEVVGSALLRRRRQRYLALNQLAVAHERRC